MSCCSSDTAAPVSVAAPTASAVLSTSAALATVAVLLAGPVAAQATAAGTGRHSSREQNKQLTVWLHNSSIFSSGFFSLLSSVLYCMAGPWYPSPRSPLLSI